MLKRIIKLFIWIFVIFGIIFYVKYDNVKDLTLTESKTINVEKGDNLNAVLKRELGLEGLFLKLYLHNNPELKNFNLQVGSYEVHTGENLKSIIETLKYGSKAEQISLTILPGWNIFDIDEYLYSKGLTKKGEFIEEAKNTSKYKKKYIFLENALTLEGFLYPDTHFVNPNNFVLENFVNTLLKNFETKVYDKYLSGKTGEKIIETINMASIVEREERNINEKAIVAGILLKRLKENWFIGADITACYTYSLTEEECKMNLSKYISEKNEYNTRTKVGLPKTPINNPSISSIEAVLNPKTTEYYYYLHGKNGEIHYAKTNEEHNQNKIYLK